jgi:hypothetical protein
MTMPTSPPGLISLPQVFIRGGSAVPVGNSYLVC